MVVLWWSFRCTFREIVHSRQARTGEFLGSTQKFAILMAHDVGMPTAELARKHGIHPNTLRLYRAKYGGMDASDVAQMRALT
jgi:hypothetical protein